MVTTLKHKIFCIVTYLFFIIGVLWYLIDKDIQKNTFSKFHFKQAINLVVVYFILMILASIIGFVPFIGWFTTTLLIPAMGFLFLCLIILQVIMVLLEKESLVPVLGLLVYIYLDF